MSAQPVNYAATFAERPGGAVERAHQRATDVEVAAGRGCGVRDAACAGTRAAAAAAVSSSTAALELRAARADDRRGAHALALRVSRAQRRGTIERCDGRRRVSVAPGQGTVPPLP